MRIRTYYSIEHIIDGETLNEATRTAHYDADVDIKALYDNITCDWMKLIREIASTYCIEWLRINRHSDNAICMHISYRRGMICMWRHYYFSVDVVE